MRPTRSTCLSSQYSPRCECDTPPSVLELTLLPMLCLDVTTRCLASSAAMRMMQPFDLVVSSYGPVEYCAIVFHCEHEVPVSS